MYDERPIKAWLNQYLYYIIIGILSLLMLFFLPMLGSTVGLAWVLPNTVVGWVIWVITNVSGAVLNVLMFHTFIKQGKVNILEHDNYKKANLILTKVDKKKAAIPLSPSAWHLRQYRNKGITIFIFTLLGSIGLAQAVLMFNAAKFLTQIFVLAMGLIFGFLEMKSVEEYWTTEYLAYAEMVDREQKQNNITQEDTSSVNIQ